MQWVASTLHTTSEHGVSSISTADAHTSAASSRLNWRPPADLNGLVRFARKTKSGFCACAITFQTQSIANGYLLMRHLCVKSGYHIMRQTLPLVTPVQDTDNATDAPCMSHTGVRAWDTLQYNSVLCARGKPHSISYLKTC